MSALPGLAFHHFGLAAREPERAAAFLAATGYRCGDVVHDPLQGVDLRWCERAGSPSVEIVSPTPAGDGPLASVLAAQGTSFYHLCYEIDDSLDVVLARLQSEGIRLVTVRAPLPAVLFGGRRVSFHVARGFGLVELLEPADGAASPARAG